MNHPAPSQKRNSRRRKACFLRGRLLSSLCSGPSDESRIHRLSSDTQRRRKTKLRRLHCVGHPSLLNLITDRSHI
ncbi:hypothetical protein Nepgr_026146 [Nepenthes gracilis]|uniref:Uncharacterized protein n=1 Tax=Nepenthes gracilis TaxID=150966 RepID=A0AAD3T6B4_NEPGR|nr:hypothetical protein Nepgr_026146 [Nepenthes gracilis]